MESDAKMRSYKTAFYPLIDQFVALEMYAPASERYGHAAFYIVRFIDGGKCSVFAADMTRFCL